MDLMSGMTFLYSECIVGDFLPTNIKEKNVAEKNGGDVFCSVMTFIRRKNRGSILGGAHFFLGGGNILGEKRVGHFVHVPDEECYIVENRIDKSHSSMFILEKQ